MCCVSVKCSSYDMKAPRFTLKVFAEQSTIPLYTGRDAVPRTSSFVIWSLFFITSTEHRSICGADLSCWTPRHGAHMLHILTPSTLHALTEGGRVGVAHCRMHLVGLSQILQSKHRHRCTAFPSNLPWRTQVPKGAPARLEGKLHPQRMGAPARQRMPPRGRVTRPSAESWPQNANSVQWFCRYATTG